MENMDRSWDFSKTMYRNFYDNRVRGLQQNGRWLKLMKFHVEKNPDWNGQEGGVDIRSWIRKRIGTSEPECPGGGPSWICTLANTAGVMSKEELDKMIKYKEEVVLKREGGEQEYREYQKLGSVLERKMRADVYHQRMYQMLYDNWLKKCVQLLDEGKGKEAEGVYYECVQWLVDNYGVKVRW